MRDDDRVRGCHKRYERDRLPRGENVFFSPFPSRE
jgi:hypothetical protein